MVEVIDGVRVFWAEGPEPLTANLVFRVGLADESMVCRGITHLVEHLALSGWAQYPDLYNGSVDQTLTSFIVSGGQEAVVDYLNAVVNGLDSLPFARMATEVSILRTEETRRGASATAQLLALRFGAQGYGLPAYPEFGLRDLDQADVDRWRQASFTSANAALWFSGPPPAGLDLSALSSGSRRPPPVPRPLDQKMPAWFPTRQNIVAVSMLAPRSVTLRLAVGVVAQRLRARLREAEGLSYDVSSSYEPLGADHAHVVVWADTLAERADAVRDAMSAELSAFVLSGPTTEELDELRSTARRQRAALPQTAAVQARFLAVNWLLTGEVDDLEANDRISDEATPDQVRQSWRQAADSMIWLVPQGATMLDRRLVLIPDHSPSAVEGRVFTPQVPAEPGQGEQHLTVGGAGVTWRRESAGPVTVWYDSCVAMQAWDDGARVLWGPDGLRVFVHELEWEGGAEAVAAVDEHVSAEVVVHMHEGSDYTPRQAPPSPTPDSAPPSEARSKRRFRRSR